MYSFFYMKIQLSAKQTKWQAKKLIRLDYDIACCLQYIFCLYTLYISGTINFNSHFWGISCGYVSFSYFPCINNFISETLNSLVLRLFGRYLHLRNFAIFYRLIHNLIWSDWNLTNLYRLYSSQHHWSIKHKHFLYKSIQLLCLQNQSV